MANIFKYADKASYTAATDRPAHESSVSYDGATNHFDGKNPLIPWSSRGIAPIGSILVKDGNSGAKFFIPEDKFDSASLDHSLQVMDCVKFGNCNGKALLMHKSCKGTLWGADCYWALDNYYKIECDTTASGGFHWAITISDSAKSGDVSWEAGATIASIVAQINAVVSGIAIDKTTFIGISISSYSNSTLTLTDNTGATLTDLSTKCRIYGEEQVETHRTWQAQNVNTILPNSGMVVTTATYSNGGWNNSYRCGMDLATFIAYFSTNGNANYVAESAVDIMRKSAFDDLATSEVAEQKAVYDKYNGDYNAYMANHMMKLDDTHANGSEWLSYDNGQALTEYLSNVKTLNLDGEWVSAFPAFEQCYKTFVSGDADFAHFHLPTMHELGMMMSGDVYAVVNRAITKIGGTPLYNTTNYWSCCEYNYYGAWIYDANGSAIYDRKFYGLYCRPVLAQ